MRLPNLNITQIKEKISLSLPDLINDQGFIYKKGANDFVKVDSGFKYVIHLIYTTWSDHYSIDTHLYLSNVRVEKILKKIVGQNSGITMGNEIGVIYNSPDGKQVVNQSMPILIFQSEDVEAAAYTLADFYRRIALPYFKQYSNLEAINDILNNPPYDHNPAHVGGSFDERCMRGLILARLTNRSDYDRLVSLYDKEIKETTIESISSYELLKEFLKYNDISNMT